MGNKYTIEQYEWEGGLGREMWTLLWEGESTLAAFWLMFKWRKNTCIRLVSRW